MQAFSSGPDKAEIARLQAVIANMTGRPGQYASTGMPSAPDPYSDASLLSSARPRPFYCWLHGFNIMRANPEYTSYQKNATSPDGTGGNPSIGVPVHFTCPRSKFFAPLHRFCIPCLPFSTLSPNCLIPPPPITRLSKIVLPVPPMIPKERAQ